MRRQGEAAAYLRGLHRQLDGPDQSLQRWGPTGICGRCSSGVGARGTIEARVSHR